MMIIQHERGGIHLEVQLQHMSGGTVKIRKQSCQSTQSLKFNTVTCQERSHKIFISGLRSETMTTVVTSGNFQE